jgi:hypothetical protein
MKTFLKFKLGNVIKKTGEEINTWAELQEAVGKIFGSASKNLSLFYFDFDDEKIELVDDNDWQVCYEEKQSLTKGDVCNISILLENSNMDPEAFKMLMQSLEDEDLCANQ